MLVLLQLNSPLGTGYSGVTFNLSTVPAGGTILPLQANANDLVTTGVLVDVSDGTTAVLLTPTTGGCLPILITLPIVTTTTTTSTSTTSTTTTTTVFPNICFSVSFECVGSSVCFDNLQLPTAGNAPQLNGRPQYILVNSPLHRVYYNGTQWVNEFSSTGGIIQTLASTDQYPISDGINSPIWTPVPIIGVNGYLSSVVLENCPTTTTTSTTTTSTTTSTSTTSTSTTSSTSTSTTSSTTSTSSTTTTTTQQPCCSPVINSLVITGPPTGSNYPLQVNYTVPTSGCNTCFSMEFRVDTTGTGTGWNAWSAMPANACTQTTWQLPFLVPNGTLVQLRIISIGGICPASTSFVFTLPTTTSTTTAAPCVPGVNTCAPVITSYTPNSACGLTTDVAIVSTPPFGGSGCNQTISYNILPGNCKCVAAVFLDHRSVNWVSWTQGSPVAFTPSGFINVCNLLSLYNNITAALGNSAWIPIAFEIRLRVFYTDGSTATSPTYLIMPNIKYQNITTSAANLSGWAPGGYCNTWLNQQGVAPGATICIQGSINGTITAFNAIGFC